MQKRLSIIIPCYNHGEFLAEAVESVRRMRRSDVELIIVDDGSTDDFTRQEMDRFSAEGVFVIRQKNCGLAAARNAGVCASHGEYILPLDADNRIRPDYVTEGIRILDGSSRIGVVYGDVNYFGTRTGRKRVRPFDKNRLLRWNFLDACAVYRRIIWEQNKGYDGTMPVQGFEDWDFWLSTVENNWQFAYVPRVLFDYRVAKESMITRASAREVEVKQFVMAKHTKMYSQVWFSIPDPTSFKATAFHAMRLMTSKIAERTSVASHKLSK
jgi:glycosyltransferase involved in cell wall biosynthesis